MTDLFNCVQQATEAVTGRNTRRAVCQHLHGVRAGDFRRLLRGVERHPRAAYAADGGDQCLVRHHRCRRHAANRDLPDRTRTLKSPRPAFSARLPSSWRASTSSVALPSPTACWTCSRRKRSKEQRPWKTLRNMRLGLPDWCGPFYLTLRGLSSPCIGHHGQPLRHDRHDAGRHRHLLCGGNPWCYGLIIGAMVAGCRHRPVPRPYRADDADAGNGGVDALAGGLAAVLIAIAAVLHARPHVHDGSIHRVLNCSWVALLVPSPFTASVFAYGKLAAKKWAKPLKGGWVKPVQAIAVPGHAGLWRRVFHYRKLNYFYAMTAWRWCWVISGSPRSAAATCRWWFPC
jgi:hypothetical protein